MIRDYLRAKKQLLQAKENNFQNPSEIKTALKGFQSAAAYDPHFHPATIGLAYCLILQTRFHEAKQKLEGVLRNAPQNADALSLLSFIKEEGENLLQSRLNQLALSSLSFEEVYAQTLESIQKKVKELVSIELPQTGLSQTLWKDYETSYDSLQATLQELNHDLEALGEELETLSLSQELYPLENLLYSYQQAYRSVVETEGLLRAINTLGFAVHEAYTHLDKENPSASEELLESFLDQSDAITDCLEDFIERGWNIRNIERPYTILKHLIEAYQDALDG